MDHARASISRREMRGERGVAKGGMQMRGMDSFVVRCHLRVERGPRFQEATIRPESKEFIVVYSSIVEGTDKREGKVLRRKRNKELE